MKNQKKNLALLCTVVYSVCCLAFNIKSIPVLGESATQKSENFVARSFDLPNYQSYIDKTNCANIPSSPVVIGSLNIIPSLSKGYMIDTYADKSNVCIINDEKSSVTYQFDVQEEGLFNLVTNYIQIDNSKITDMKFDVKIDGMIPSVSMKNVSLPRYWGLKGNKVYDKRGNELYRESVQVMKWCSYSLHDCEGRYNDPLMFYLSSGKHTVTFDFEYSGLAIEKITFCSLEKPEKYKKLNKKVEDIDSLIIQAEDYSKVSDASITINIDKTDPAVIPNDAHTMRYNTVGGLSYDKTGQTIYWNVDVKKSGYYKIAIKARQNQKKGFSSTRRFRIDGKVPYAECENIQFMYSPDWYNMILKDANEESMLFYLEEGTHELSLECIPGVFSESMSVLDGCINELNKIFLQVYMIVGNSADKFRDYYLSEDLPYLKSEVVAVVKKLKIQKTNIQKISGKKGGELSALDSLITQLDYFYSDIDKMAIKLDSFKSNISMLSAWILDLKTQPLEIDSLCIYTEDKDLLNTNVSFFKKISFTATRLLLSFNKDYGVIGDYSKKDSLTVWTSTGQDQLDITKNLITKNFAENSDVSIKVQLVPSGLLEAVMAGKGPDVAMFISGDTPVNIACRGGLVNLKEFYDFSSVASRFMPNATVPYEYKGGCYALPITQEFNMLFVRTDIFEKLKLPIPNTWDDLFEILPVLQRKNLEVGIPSDLSTFATLAFQKGGTYYNSDLTATSFNCKPEISAFIMWTNLFSKSGLSLAYDFSNRFRTGEMPIGISNYSTYALLETSAPEISDRWKMFPIFSTINENGSVNRSVSVATKGAVGLQQGNTSAVILKNCINKKKAWNFLKWFLSTDTQTSYGLSLEMRMGVAARYTPANVETLKKLPWSQDERDTLLSQWKDLVLLPEIPGSYYVTRHLSNAFRKVVYDKQNANYNFNKYNEMINREIKRKREELESVN